MPLSLDLTRDINSINNLNSKVHSIQRNPKSNILEAIEKRSFICNFLSWFIHIITFTLVPRNSHLDQISRNIFKNIEKELNQNLTKEERKSLLKAVENLNTIIDENGGSESKTAAKLYDSIFKIKTLKAVKELQQENENKAPQPQKPEDLPILDVPQQKPRDDEKKIILPKHQKLEIETEKEVVKEKEQQPQEDMAPLFEDKQPLKNEEKVKQTEYQSFENEAEVKIPDENKQQVRDDLDLFFDRLLATPQEKVDLKRSKYLNQEDLQPKENIASDPLPESEKDAEDRRIMEALDQLQKKQEESIIDIHKKLEKIVEKTKSIYSVDRDKISKETYQCFKDIVNDILEGEIDPKDLEPLKNDKHLIAIKDFLKENVYEDQTIAIRQKCMAYVDYIDHLLEVNSCSCFSAKIQEDKAREALLMRNDIIDSFAKPRVYRRILSHYILNNYIECNKIDKEKKLFVLRLSGTQDYINHLNQIDKLPVKNDLFYVITMTGENENHQLINFNLGTKKWSYDNFQFDSLDSLFQTAFKDAEPIGCISNTLLLALKIGDDKRNKNKYYKMA